MKSILAILLIGVLIGISMPACISSSGTSGATVGTASLAEDKRHRLYAAALAASEFPLESETFKEVCKKIGIFDAQGQPNANYMAFVQEHIEWSMKPKTEQFKREINTKEKAQEYIKRYLS